MGRPRKGKCDEFGRECTKCGVYKSWIEFKCPGSTYVPIRCLECVRNQRHAKHPNIKPQNPELQNLIAAYRFEYHVWRAMKQRCVDVKFKAFKYYGGRGISVCAGLLQFETFMFVMGPRPNSYLTLDRENNNGHYSCGSCEECLQKGWSLNVRWATRTEQIHNRRNSPRYLNLISQP